MNVDGFSYETWYTMPVNLRNHYIIVIQNQTDEKNKQLKQMRQQEQRFSNIKGIK